MMHSEESVFTTPVGPVGICWQGDRPLRVWLVGDEAPVGEVAPVDPTAAAAWQGLILAVLAGERPSWSVPPPEMTAFQQAVLRVTAQIPRGQVRSYGWVANAVGHPGAARAVGTALARNPLPILIPCHRVLPAQGPSLGAYSSGQGASSKARLLAYEGVTAHPCCRRKLPPDTWAALPMA